MLSKRAKAIRVQLQKMVEQRLARPAFDVPAQTGSTLIDSSGTVLEDEDVIIPLGVKSYSSQSVSTAMASDGVQYPLVTQIDVTCAIGDTILIIGKIGNSDKRMDLDISGDTTNVYANSSGTVTSVQTATGTSYTFNLWGKPVGTTNVTATNNKLIIIVIRG